MFAVVHCRIAQRASISQARLRPSPLKQTPNCPVLALCCLLVLRCKQACQSTYVKARGLLSPLKPPPKPHPHFIRHRQPFLFLSTVTHLVRAGPYFSYSPSLSFWTWCSVIFGIRLFSRYHLPFHPLLDSSLLYVWSDTLRLSHHTTPTPALWLKSTSHQPLVLSSR